MARLNSEFTHILYTNPRGFANTAMALPIKREDVAAAEQRAADLNMMHDNTYSYVTTWPRASTKAKQWAMQQVRNMRRIEKSGDASDGYRSMLAEWVMF